MAANLFAHAKTGGPTGPKAPVRFSMAQSGTAQARQSVARAADLTTFRQNCGTFAMNGDLWGGSPSQGRCVVSQFISLQAAGREVFP
jgi:hypothetical protein